MKSCMKMNPNGSGTIEVCPSCKGGGMGLQGLCVVCKGSGYPIWSAEHHNHPIFRTNEKENT